MLSVSLNTNEIWHNNCITQTSPWSPCSKTCGRGVSLRFSNDNDQCVMEQESRLCNLRPCDVDITKHFRVNTNFVCFVIPQFVVFNYSFLISITSLVVHFPLLFKITMKSSSITEVVQLLLLQYKEALTHFLNHHFCHAAREEMPEHLS